MLARRMTESAFIGWWLAAVFSAVIATAFVVSVMSS